MRPGHWLYTIPLRLRSLFRREQADQELEDELREHVERKTEENIAKGMRPEEARRQALLEMGGIEKRKEECRDLRRVNWIQDPIQDLRFGLRMLLKNPGFTAVAILTLALGIGVNASVFGIFDTFMFQQLPVKDPGRLTYLVALEKQGGEAGGFSHDNFEYIQSQTSSLFSDFSAIGGDLMRTDGISINGKNQLIQTSYVSGNFFNMLGIRPALGRFILASEGKTPNADPIVVLSYSFWKTTFNSDPDIVGKKVAINGHPVTIVGVAPQGFHGAVLALIDAQAYLPLGMAASDSGTMPGGLVLARLRDGVNLSQAETALDAVAHRLSQQYPDDKTWKTLQARELGPLGPLTGANPIPLLAALFLTLAGLVLLLACVNITNLLLARATTRRREMAVRSALGAARKRLIGQSLTETILLALFGGGFGMLLGLWAIRAMGSFPINISGSSSPIFLGFRFDWRVFAYALAAALISGALVGIVPAVRASGVNLSDFLHNGGRTAGEKHDRRRNILVIAQVAGSLMLLIVAGLFARSLANVQNVDLGFDPAHVLNLSVNPNQAGYNAAQGRLLLGELLDRVRALPGIESASFAATVPLGSTRFAAFLHIEGYQPHSGERTPFAGANMVSSEYFATMGIPILSGRGILDSDNANSTPVAVINQAMAAQFWPGQNPIGRHFTGNDPGLPHPVTMEVIGVVRNSRTRTLATSLPIGPYFYKPLAQDYRLPATLQIRTANPLGMAHGVLDLIRTLAPMLPVFDVQTMTQALDSINGLVLFKIGAGLAASLGTLGLVLAIVGVYGVVSYTASLRTHEIGIRAALGAERKQILAMILRQGCATVGAGLGAGLLASLAIARLVRNFLVGVSAVDPLTYLGVSALLALVALAACYIPARCAMRVDPMVALRYE